MQTIESVKQQIELNTELLSETKKRIQNTTIKLSEARGNVKNIEVQIKDTKEKRQAALARGGDSKGLNDSLKKLESEAELETETVAGLEKFQAELREEERTLELKAGELPKRILQLKSVELAASYNSLAEKMAEVVRGLNAIHFEIDRSGYNGKANRVVFLPADYLENIPCAFFDSEGLTLEQFVEKNPGKYHSNIHCPACDKYFYIWDAHKQRLIEQKTD